MTIEKSLVQVRGVAPDPPTGPPVSPTRSPLCSPSPEQLPGPAQHLPAPGDRAQAAEQAERHRQEAPGWWQHWGGGHSGGPVRRLLWALGPGPTPLLSSQGTVTEDKSNASHIVCPVPGNLEEGGCKGGTPLLRARGETPAVGGVWGPGPCSASRAALGGTTGPCSAPAPLCVSRRGVGPAGHEARQAGPAALGLLPRQVRGSGWGLWGCGWIQTEPPPVPVGCPPCRGCCSHSIPLRPQL